MISTPHRTDDVAVLGSRQLEFESRSAVGKQRSLWRIALAATALVVLLLERRGLYARWGSAGTVTARAAVTSTPAGSYAATGSIPTRLEPAFLGTHMASAAAPVTAVPRTPRRAATAKLRVTATPTGYLNVRSSPSTASSIIAKVAPGTIYPDTGTRRGWYRITLPDGQSGWVTRQYVEQDDGE